MEDFVDSHILQALCNTPIASVEGCVCPREGSRSATPL